MNCPAEGPVLSLKVLKRALNRSEVVKVGSKDA